MGSNRNVIFPTLRSLAGRIDDPFCRRVDSKYQIGAVYHRSHWWEVPAGEQLQMQSLSWVRYAATLPMARCGVAKLCLLLSESLEEEVQEGEGIWHCRIKAHSAQWWATTELDARNGRHYIGEIHGPLIYNPLDHIRYTQRYDIFVAYTSSAILEEEQVSS